MLVGCWTQEPRGECGESFCLPATATLVAKETPVHDFNIYQVEWRGERFGIYEGNHPRRQPESRSSALSLPLDPSAKLSVADGRGSVVIRIARDCRAGEPCWPEFLDLTGPCASSDKCEVAAFAAELSRRR